MACRDILVQIDETAASRPRAAAAAAVASRFQAHLTGVFLKSQFFRTYLGAEAFGYKRHNEQVGPGEAVMPRP